MYSYSEIGMWEKLQQELTWTHWVEPNSSSKLTRLPWFYCIFMHLYKSMCQHKPCLSLWYRIVVVFTSLSWSVHIFSIQVATWWAPISRSTSISHRKHSHWLPVFRLLLALGCRSRVSRFFSSLRIVIRWFHDLLSAHMGMLNVHILVYFGRIPSGNQWTSDCHVWLPEGNHQKSWFT